MITIDLKKIALHLHGELTFGDDLLVSRVETDSRKNVSGALFVALKGEKFDAHVFAADIAKNGALALIVDHDTGVNIPQIIVKDTTIALGLLGQLNRLLSKARVVSVTGTCGKTSVKEMTASILSRLGKTIATSGNFNNAIGVPLSLLQINADTDFAVIELGANHPGEISYSVNLARPISAVINNVGGAHLLGFGSLDGVYKAKSEILDYVFANNGTGIVNADNAYFAKWCEEYQGNNLLSFSVNNPIADFKAKDIVVKDNGCCTFTIVTPMGESFIDLQIPGTHNVANAVAACALSSRVGANLEQISLGLNSVKPVKGRLFFEKLGNLTLIDDAYNASVNAVKASIDTLSLLPGYKVFVFGDMGELGSEEKKLHQEIGEYAIGKIDVLLTIGHLAKYSAESFGGMSFKDKSELYTYLKELMNAHTNMFVAVKGSHVMHMNEVVDFIRKFKEVQC